MKTGREKDQTPSSRYSPSAMYEPTNPIQLWTCSVCLDRVKPGSSAEKDTRARRMKTAAKRRRSPMMCTGRALARSLLGMFPSLVFCVAQGLLEPCIHRCCNYAPS